MIVRRYRPSDFKQIREWGAKWGAEYNEDQFPSVGFIIDNVAAYFLYSTDSSVCWLENMISNRGIDSQTRDVALDLLIEAILDEARNLGYAIAYAATDFVEIAKRAKEHGAMVRPGYLLTKDLTSKTQ